MKPAKLCNEITIIGPIIYPMATEPLLEISIKSLLLPFLS